MNKFCANCGSPVTSGQKYCTGCGTPNVYFEGSLPLRPDSEIDRLREMEEAAFRKAEDMRRLREEQEKIQKERLARIDHERMERERLSRLDREQEEIRQLKIELLAQIEQERLRAERERQEKEQLEKELKAREEAERMAREKEELLKAEHERIQKERLEKARQEIENATREKELLLKAENERLEKERIEKEKAVREKEQLLKAERERLEKIELENARIDAENATLEEIHRKLNAETARRERELAERERLAREQRAREQEERLALEKEQKLKAEKELALALQLEEERKAQEEAEKAALEETRRKLTAESEQLEREQLARERKTLAEIKKSEGGVLKVEDGLEQIAQLERERKAREEAENAALAETRRKLTAETGRREKEQLEKERKALEVLEVEALKEAERKLDPELVKADVKQQIYTDTRLREEREKLVQALIGAGKRANKPVESKLVKVEREKLVQALVSTRKKNGAKPVATTQKRRKSNLWPVFLTMMTLVVAAGIYFLYPRYMVSHNYEDAKNALNDHDWQKASTLLKATIDDANSGRIKMTKDTLDVIMQWQKASVYLAGLANDMNDPKYSSLPGLIILSSKLDEMHFAQLDFIDLMRRPVPGTDGHYVLKPVIQANDSVQIALLTFFMEHPSYIVEMRGAAIISQGNQRIDMNRIYNNIIDPDMKRQCEYIYKQIVIRNSKPGTEPATIDKDNKGAEAPAAADEQSGKNISGLKFHEFTL